MEHKKGDTVSTENRAKSMSLMTFKETISFAIIDYANREFQLALSRSRVISMNYDPKLF